MRKLFWANICLVAIISCTTSSFSDSQIIQEGYLLSGVEAQEFYSQYKDESPRILYNLAYSYLESNDIDMALSLAVEGIEKYPEYLRFYQLKAYCHRAEEDFVPYQATLQQILELDPGSKEIRELLIDFFVDDEQEDNAIKAAKELLYIDSKNTVALNALSLYIPFFQELTGYTPIEKAVTDAMEKIRLIEILDLEPKLYELSTLPSD